MVWKNDSVNFCDASIGNYLLLSFDGYIDLNRKQKKSFTPVKDIKVEMSHLKKIHHFLQFSDNIFSHNFEISQVGYRPQRLSRPGKFENAAYFYSLAYRPH